MRYLAKAVLLALLLFPVEALSQSGTTISLTRFGPGYGGAMLVVNRVVVCGDLGVGPYAVHEGFTLHYVTPPVPGTSPIVGINGDSTTPIALLANGDVYACEYTDARHWRYLDNALSNVVAVPPNTVAGDQVGIGVLPNPSRGDFRLDLVLPEDGDIALDVVDVAGRQVGQGRTVHLTAGRHLGLEVLGAAERPTAAGTYFVRAHSRLGVISAKAVVIN